MASSSLGARANKPKVKDARIAPAKKDIELEVAPVIGQVD